MRRPAPGAVRAELDVEIVREVQSAHSGQNKRQLLRVLVLDACGAGVLDAIHGRVWTTAGAMTRR